MTTQDRKRKPVAAVFIDGNNLYYAARTAFKSTRHDIDALARKICELKGWSVGSVNFYQGIPSKTHDPHTHEKWEKRIAVMQQQGVNVVTRDLVYRKKTVIGPDGKESVSLRSQEKGIDVRIALDVVRTAYEKKADVFVIFSQDQDLLEACLEVKRISADQKRAVRICSAFPCSDLSTNHRGIRDVEAISIDEKTYNKCLDDRPYHKTLQEVLDFNKRPDPKVNLVQEEFAATQARHAASAQKFVSGLPAEVITPKPRPNKPRRFRPGPKPLP
jgi:uncharacterized LabA/DUF88 family protein